MLDLGFLAFTQPWLLGALALLPAIWLLLRVTPPAPRRALFPPLRILLRLERREETPARTPLWLLLLRLALAALLVLATAGPVLQPAPHLPGTGPLLIVLDDGWASAPGWRERIATLESLLDQAEREGRETLLLRTAPDERGVVLERGLAGEFRRGLEGLRPRPWPVDRAAARAALAGLEGREVMSVWLADGLARDEDDRTRARALAEALRALGPLLVYADPPERTALLLSLPELAADGFELAAQRATGVGGERRTVRALGPEGEILAAAELVFAEGERRAKLRLALPPDLRNRVARLEIPGAGIGGVVLLDERWRRRSVGIVGAPFGGADQPLLSEVYFLERALAPFAEVRRGALSELVTGDPSMIVLPDIGRLADPDRELLARWVERGGVLLRFAGPRLAAGGDSLLPVPLRAGDRELGGALSWSEPLPLAPFPPESPFAGLVPTRETVVRRQILAEPGPQLSGAVWAQLEDGTPIVTGRRLGQGWLVLVHTTANTAWTNLPLSGLFVEMLRRTLALAPGTGVVRRGLLELDRALAADGALEPPRPDLLPVEAGALAAAVPGPRHPPGLWIPVGADRDETGRTALNLQAGVREPLPLPLHEFASNLRGYGRAREVDLAPWLLLAALLLALVDLVIGWALRGLVPLPRPGAVATAAALLATFPALAQPDPRFAAAYETRFAYFLTGRPDVDRITEAGLRGLGRVLAERTSVEVGDPVPVDPARDDLALFPLVFWVVTPDHRDLSSEALKRIQHFLQTGGMIFVDTRDAAVLLPGQEGGGPGERRLAQLLAGLDLPPLQRVPPDHVLTRSFYLLQDFPGRFTGQPLWVDQVSPLINDGVSSLVIGANDWTAAWAEDEWGRTLFSVVPGGELQREMARRFGVNLVMYALTGNYKTDQVHVPALLERLGQ
ncbi:MAG: DUF4159 domain-containing protein [Geminicoccaceae bacterium]|nr:DUF4159 domain-containing protein [Geminicoccaceae bacterium]MDW8340752.1 DUF4159 domain-containing protein [Geminicoccaceae bacterium]